MARDPQPQPAAVSRALAIIIVIAAIAGIGGMLAVAFGTSTADAATNCAADTSIRFTTISTYVRSTTSTG